MLDESTSRRDFLAVSATALASLWLTADPQEIHASLRHAGHVARSSQPVAFDVFTPEEAADVEAIASQIIPTDDSPGAREAKVVYFIDHSLAGWAAPNKGDFTKGLTELNAEVEKRWPGTGRFSKLAGPQQIELLTDWEKQKKPFFEAVRSASITGMFCNPSYGGNADKIGWKLLGFEDRFAWQPPFGSYDAELMKGEQPMTQASAKFRPADTVDFVIVGSGAAGGVIAKELSTAGFTVVVLEQGPRIEPSEWMHDELRGQTGGSYTNDSKKQPQTFRKTEAEVAKVGGGRLSYHRLVGGGSVMFTANYWRFHEIDFIEKSRLGAVPGASLEDWPITYHDLEPYYTKAEWELGVSGEVGPFDPPRSKPYPMPPLPVKSSGVLFEKGARAIGLHPQPTPMAILSRPFNGRPPCQHCGFCFGNMCEYKAKSGTLYTVIPIAEATGKCEIRPNSYVRKVEMNDKGRATGVVYFDENKQEHLQSARAVVLCANGAETPRLLLMSKNSMFPNGLANSSGAVGRHLMFNGGGGAQGLFENEINDFKSVVDTRMVHDFYDSDPKRGFYGGGGLDSRGPYSPIGYAQGGLPPDAPRWGSEYKKLIAHNFVRTMSASGHTTTLPLETNRVDLDPELKDDWGLPCMRQTYKNHPDDLACSKFFQGKAKELLEAAGATKVWTGQIREQTGGVHLLGTCRMGDDPRTSVVDRNHRTHDVKNLFICDGSSLVTGGRGQPTATIQALAYRAGDLIAQAAKKHEI